MPNMYARGILFGKMVLELGDMCVAKNEKHGISCDIEFKTKVAFVSRPLNETATNRLWSIGLLLWYIQRYCRTG